MTSFPGDSSPTVVASQIRQLMRRGRFDIVPACRPPREIFNFRFFAQYKQKNLPVGKSELG